MCRMWEKQPLPESLQDLTKAAIQEKPRERHRTERAVQDMQQDGDASHHESDAVRTKMLNSCKISSM